MVQSEDNPPCNTCDGRASWRHDRNGRWWCSHCKRAYTPRGADGAPLFKKPGARKYTRKKLLAVRDCDKPATAKFCSYLPSHRWRKKDLDEAERRVSTRKIIRKKHDDEYSSFGSSADEAMEVLEDNPDSVLGEFPGHPSDGGDSDQSAYKNRRRSSDAIIPYSSLENSKKIAKEGKGRTKKIAMRAPTQSGLVSL